ncbi:MAG: FecR domain-containing protein [Leptonema sp. (in: Bacteria)]|nr:FecR domain-containing protein [Leptonema sp. (in: bacteria)]
MNRILKFAILNVIVAFLAIPLQAQSSKLGLVVFKKGNVTLIRSGKPEALKVKDLIQEKDEIRTGADGEMSLQLSSGVMVKVTANSSIIIDGILRDERGTTVALKLNNGTLLGKADRSKDKNIAMTVTSPTAIAGVRGTEFIVDANNDESTVLVNEGVVNVANDQNSVGVDVEPGNKIVSNGNDLIEGIMDQFEKQRFAIIDQFEKERSKTFEVIVEQIRKNQELMQQQRQNIP